MFLQDRRASSGLKAEVLVLVIVNIINLIVNNMGTPEELSRQDSFRASS